MNVMRIERSVEWFYTSRVAVKRTLCQVWSMLLLLDKTFHDFLFKFTYKFHDMAVRYGDLSDMDYW